MTFKEFCDKNEDLITEKYVDNHFETIGHGGDYCPLDNADEEKWLDIAERMYDNIYGGYYV